MGKDVKIISLFFSRRGIWVGKVLVIQHNDTVAIQTVPRGNRQAQNNTLGRVVRNEAQCHIVLPL